MTGMKRRGSSAQRAGSREQTRRRLCKRSYWHTKTLFIQLPDNEAGADLGLFALFICCLHGCSACRRRRRCLPKDRCLPYWTRRASRALSLEIENGERHGALNDPASFRRQDGGGLKIEHKGRKKEAGTFY